MSSPRARSVAVVLAALLVASSAAGEPTSAERVAARTLFDDGRAAMKVGDYATACPKLEESQRLDPGIGTLYNLGSCYEGQGRLASAWTTFLEVAEAAQHAHEPDREAAARARAATLEPRLPHLRVTVDGPDHPTLTLDGRPFAEGLLGTNVPIDPGGHDVGADAQGKKHWASHVQAQEAVTAVVTVPLLEDAAVTAIPLAETPVVTPPVEQPVPWSPPPTARASSWRTPTEIVAGALGVAGIGVGSGLGVLAINKWTDAKNEHCIQNAASGQWTCPSGQATDSWSTANSAGIASTASFIVGAALVATGAVLWFTRPKVAATVGARSDGRVVVEGRFP
jgi:hypothetical protein